MAFAKLNIAALKTGPVEIVHDRASGEYRVKIKGRKSANYVTTDRKNAIATAMDIRANLMTILPEQPAQVRKTRTKKNPVSMHNIEKSVVHAGEYAGYDTTGQAYRIKKLGGYWHIRNIKTGHGFIAKTLNGASVRLAEKDPTREPGYIANPVKPGLTSRPRKATNTSRAFKVESSMNGKTWRSEGIFPTQAAATEYATALNRRDDNKYWYRVTV